MRTVGDRVVVRPLPDTNDRTKSGLVVKKNISEVDEVGEVVKKGSDCKYEDIKIGSKILYPKGACADFTYLGESYRLIRESSIMIIYDDEAGE